MCLTKAVLMYFYPTFEHSKSNYSFAQTFTDLLNNCP